MGDVLFKGGVAEFLYGRSIDVVSNFFMRYKRWDGLIMSERGVRELDDFS